MIEHLTRLARIVHALRSGLTVTSGPHVQEVRRGTQTTQEWFFVGEWRVTRDTQLMHRLTTTINSSTGHSSEPTDWSPQDLMQASALWNEDELAKLPPLPGAGENKSIDLIMALADGEWHEMLGRTVRMVPDTSPNADEDCPWTLEEEGFVPNRITNPFGKPLQHMLTDLVFRGKPAVSA